MNGWLIIVHIHVSVLLDVCHWETFNATCTGNSVIMMTMANYGRMEMGRCVGNERGNIGCQQVRWYTTMSPLIAYVAFINCNFKLLYIKFTITSNCLCEWIYINYIPEHLRIYGYAMF